MALNTRQTTFITRLKTFATNMEALYGEAHALKNAYTEEFADNQDNCLLTDDSDLQDAYFFDCADVGTAINQAVANLINFWTGSAVGTRNYGTDLRRIK
jgi:hypothetical protein